MTLQTQEFRKNQTFFAEKFWENILTYLNKNFKPNFLDFGQKKAEFTRFWKN